MEIKKLSPEAYKLHDFLKENAVGKDKAIKAAELCWRLGYTNTRTLRSLRAEVNSGISELNKKILTGNDGYYIAASDQPEEAYAQYREAAWRKIKTGVSMIQEGQRLLKMIGQDTQTRLDITGGLKDIEIYVKKEPVITKTFSEVFEELNDLVKDPLVVEAMKLYAKPEEDEEDEEEEEEEEEREYTKEDYDADRGDELYKDSKIDWED